MTIKLHSSKVPTEILSDLFQYEYIEKVNIA